MALSIVMFGTIAAMADDNQLTGDVTVSAMCRTHRPANVTYGGLTPMHGYERDHRIPLCLGGPDTPDNVFYEPMDEARTKDAAERTACRYACAAGPDAVVRARDDFRNFNWYKWLEVDE